MRVVKLNYGGYPHYLLNLNERLENITVEFDNDTKRVFSTNDELWNYLVENKVWGIFDGGYVIATSSIAYALYDIIDFIGANDNGVCDNDTVSFFCINSNGIFEEIYDGLLYSLEQILFSGEFYWYIEDDIIKINCADEEYYDEEEEDYNYTCKVIQYKILDTKKYDLLCAKASAMGINLRKR